MLVEQQGEVLTSAEQNAEQTVGHMKEGNTMIAKAILSAKATRHVSLSFLFLFYPIIYIYIYLRVYVSWSDSKNPTDRQI